MYCRDCARFDTETDRCKDAKVNPADWDTAVNVSNVMGLRSICSFNDFRERLIRARMAKPLPGPPPRRSRR